jgi:hypothetical protein
MINFILIKYMYKMWGNTNYYYISLSTINIWKNNNLKYIYLFTNYVI